MANLRLKFDNLVLGGNLNAYIYAYLNNYTLVGSPSPPDMFDTFDPEMDLSRFSHRNTQKVLACPPGTPTRVVGIPKLKIWSILGFIAKTSGKNLTPSNISRINIKQNYLEIYTSSSVHFVDFEKLHIFDDRDVFGLTKTDKKTKRLFRVVDYFDVIYGGVHEFDCLLSKTEPAKEIFFHKISSKHKDLVSISVIPETKLQHPDYSDINVKFKILYLMHKAGIRKLHETNKDGIPRYVKAKISFVKRAFYPLSMPLYEPIPNAIFHNETIEEIMRDNFVVPSFASYMLYSPELL